MSEILINTATQQGGGAQYSNSASFSLNSFVRRFLNFKESFKKVLAFTLAETLIVIGIIGVVAALTIPNLNSSTADREKVAKLKKVYAQVNEAFGRAQAVYGPIDEWPFVGDGSDSVEDIELFTKRLTEFMKYQKIEYGADYPEVYLADGSTFKFVYRGFNNPNWDYENLHYWGSIYVDIDGPNKGKNKEGQDIFQFEVTENGVLPSETQYYFENYGEWDCTFGQAAEGVYYATAWVIQNGNMDYLKADENCKCNDSDIVLDWTTNTSCK